MTMRNRLLTILLVALAAALTAPAGAGAFVIGIGDQKPSMFSDPLFAGVGIHHARLAIGWDALTSDWQVAQIDDWLAAAQAANVSPLISFGHSRVHRRTLPSPERFRHEFRRFRARYPWVLTFATWNEANHCGEPTCHHARLVAAYFDVLRHECPRCRILAAEVLDQPNMVHWVKVFRRYARVEPRYWGLHNYLDANRLQTRRTRALLAATHGQVWITETGGIVARRNKSSVYFEQSARHAARVTRFVFDRIATLSARVQRVYLYHWSADRRHDTWDSALIGPHGHPRPAFRVLRRQAHLVAARRRSRS
jgi:hypothetical protein